jgi:uncharacterized membrane protein (Fun14 family)
MTALAGSSSRITRPTTLKVLAQLIVGAIVAMAIGYAFRITIHDYMQQDSDAAYFFITASTGDYDFSLDESLLLTENQLPVIAYGAIYELLADIGINADPFWGILLNALLVVTSQLIAVLYARTRFGFSNPKLIRLSLLISFNGLMMMFAGIHMRDAFLLLTATVSVVVFHPPPGPSSFRRRTARFAWLALLMVSSFLCRKEGFAVPLLIYLLSSIAPLDFRSGSVRLRLLLVVAAFVGFVLWLDVINQIVDNYNAYKLLSQDESATSSLAYSLLYELPFPFSTLAASVLLLFIKMPFWRAGLYDSYSFYMSVAAFQMLFVAPVFVGLLGYALLNRIDCRFRYLMLILVSMLFVTAVTSNQVRHFAIVYPALMIVYMSRKDILPAATQRRYANFAYSLSGAVILLSLATGAR